MKKPLPPLPWRIVLCFQNFGLWRKVRKIDAAVVSLEKLGQLDESLRLAAVSGKIWDRILGDKNNQARRETLESVNSFLNPVKKASLGNVVPDPKNDPTFSAEGNPPSERFPKGLSRQSKGTSPTPSDGRGHGVTP